MYMTILITGATSGIGEATALELAKNANTMILPVRNIQKGNTLKTKLIEINPSCQIDMFECDFESLESVKNCANQIVKNYKNLDILINNAGIMEADFRQTKDNLEAHFQVNVLSQYIFNQILIPLVPKGGKIINLSSMAHLNGKFELDTISAKPSGILSGVGLYSNSNLYRNLLTVKLANENPNLNINCVHPGIIRTNLGSQSDNFLWKMLMPIFHFFTKPSTEGAKTSIYLALTKENISGKYWADCKVKTPSKLSLDTELANKLAQKCKELTNL